MVFVTRRGDAVGVLRVELARNVWRRARGLMGRTELPDNGGMLFVYPWRRVVRIWMAGVQIPLDVLFIDEKDTVMRIVTDLAPGSMRAICSGTPVSRVLEVGAGLVARLGIEIGDAVCVRFDGKEGAKQNASAAHGWRGLMTTLMGRRS
jgi:uncharacterized membrane protein (UPF0127 family)